ncbi:MAG: hypothetical protein OXR66_02925 [Candidatus Woesearchaeota archaeon]|nr:hypothetical protein [Candidatus Woesearchaeota archaeon]
MRELKREIPEARTASGRRALPPENATPPRVVVLHGDYERAPSSVPTAGAVARGRFPETVLVADFPYGHNEPAKY